MALNQFMHPRNIYRKKRNFSKLAQEYPEFAPFLKHFANGNTTINFSDANAVRCLTRCLLRKDFELDVNIPNDRLIPAVPQRLNYVLWVEDLLQSFQISREVHGLDIGTGCCCIFCLLVCRKNPSWKMTGLEIDHDSFQSADDNVRRNKLCDKITVIQSGNWLDILSCPNTKFAFSMCNPPFFAKEEHHGMDEESTMDNVKHDGEDKVSRKSSGNASCPIESEAVGGEATFVLKMIHDSFSAKDRVKIFTVMLGRKSSLTHLKKHLRNFQHENDDLTFTSTQFCQGRTMRWGLAWSFTLDLQYCRDTPGQVKKTHKPVVLDLIPYRKGMFYSIEGITDMLLTWIIQDLEIKTYRLTKLAKHSSEIVITSQINTWSNQRRKRRQQQRMKDHQGPLSLTGQDDSPPIIPCADEVVSWKRKNRDEDDNESLGSSSRDSSLVESHQHHEDEPLMKRLREEIAKPELEALPECKSDIKYLLHASITLKREGKGISLRMQTLEGSINPETTYQLFQYFKNRLS